MASRYQISTEPYYGLGNELSKAQGRRPEPPVVVVGFGCRWYPDFRVHMMVVEREGGYMRRTGVGRDIPEGLE